MLNKFVRLVSSLRLTVALLTLAILLVFFGTLAQVNEGLYAAQHRWFHSFIVWWPAQQNGWRLPILPGGYLVGSLLVVNLIAAHLQRFRFTWSKAGIHITHGGLILLLLGQLSTDMLSRETTINFAEGESRDYSTSPTVVELAVSTDAGHEDKVLAIPQALLKVGSIIENPNLPFAIRVKEFYPNSDLFTRDDILKAADQLGRALSVVEAEYSNDDLLVGMAEKSLETEGRSQIWRDALKSIGESDNLDIVTAAKGIITQPQKAAALRSELKKLFQSGMIQRFKMQGGPLAYVAQRLEHKEAIDEGTLKTATSNGAGSSMVLIAFPEVKTTEERNMPAYVLELVAKNESLGTWLAHPTLDGQDVKVGERIWRVTLRFERHYFPFSLTLLKTTHEVYRGTDIPKNFQSRVRIDNPTKHENRDVDIYMNNPLRYEGLTFYQYQMGRDEVNQNIGTSALQVVKNPGWLTPYVGCGLVTLGLLIQFLQHLTGFIRKRRTT